MLYHYKMAGKPALKAWEKQFIIDSENFSAPTVNYLIQNEVLKLEINKKFLLELDNPETYKNMNTVNTFIEKRKDTPYFIENIPKLIENINKCMNDNTREIEIRDIVAIKAMTQGKTLFADLDNAMEQIIKVLLASMLVSCEQIIKSGNDILFERLPQKEKLVFEEAKAWFYLPYNESGEAVTEQDFEAFKQNTTIDMIQKSFELSPQTTYHLGRFSSIKPDPPNINKIPVFSSTHPFIESKNHAILTVDDDQKVTIQNMKNNGTFILRGNVTIKLLKDICRLFTNDVICIGPGEINNREGIKTVNDARYKLNIPKPTTIILNGFIECSVGDAQSLMASIVVMDAKDKQVYMNCIYNNEYFKNPTSQREGGGPAYITIAGRRRKIHIEKGKQYVNYKSELILVTKLKKLIK